MVRDFGITSWGGPFRQRPWRKKHGNSQNRPAAKMGRRIISRIFLKLLPDVKKKSRQQEKVDKKLKENRGRRSRNASLARPENWNDPSGAAGCRWLHSPGRRRSSWMSGLGRETVSGYFMREVSEVEAAELEARGVPLVRRRWKIHKESPLMALWWIQKTREFAKVARHQIYRSPSRALPRLWPQNGPLGLKGRRLTLPAVRLPTSLR